MIAKGELNTCDIVTTNKSKDIKDDIAINSPWYIENDLIVFHSGKKIYVYSWKNKKPAL